MESAAEESASGALDIQRFDPAFPLVAGDSACPSRYLHRPLGENRMDAPRLAVEGDESPHPHVDETPIGEHGRERRTCVHGRLSPAIATM